jgi:hypothetical protein
VTSLALHLPTLSQRGSFVLGEVFESGLDLAAATLAQLPLLLSQLGFKLSNPGLALGNICFCCHLGCGFRPGQGWQVSALLRGTDVNQGAGCDQASAKKTQSVHGVLPLIKCSQQT